MFELVDSQPSHRVSADVLNLTPGNSLLPSMSVISHSKRFKKNRLEWPHVYLEARWIDQPTSLPSGL